MSKWSQLESKKTEGPSADQTNNKGKKGKLWKVTDEIKAVMDSIPSLGEHFSLTKNIGHGAFSSVYLAHLKNPKMSQQDLAIKWITPTSHPSRIFIELKCLKIMGGSNNIVKVLYSMRHQQHFAFVMPYFPHDYFPDYAGKLSFTEVVDYIYNLVIALEKVHSCHIVHRDIKPGNFLYNRALRRYCLVDFGLAQDVGGGGKENSNFAPIGKSGTMPSQNSDAISNSNKRKSIVEECSPRKRQKRTLGNVSDEKNVICDKTPTLQSSPRLRQRRSVCFVEEIKLQPSLSQTRRDSLPYNRSCQCLGQLRYCSICVAKPPQNAARAGTPGFRPPEVLLKHPNQTTAIDIWSAGVIFLSIISGKTPFFQPSEDLVSLAEISALLGTRSIKTAALRLKKYFITSEERPALDLEMVCVRLRGEEIPFNPEREETIACSQCQQIICCACAQTNTYRTPKKGRGQKLDSIADQLALKASMETKNETDRYPSLLYKFLERFLDPNPHTRITASQAVNHRFFLDCRKSNNDTKNS